MHQKFYRLLTITVLTCFAYSGFTDDLDNIIAEQTQDAVPATNDDLGEIIAEQGSDSPPVIKKDIAILKVLNKVSGRSSQLTIKVNETQSFEDLDISAFSCQERPPEYIPESGIFLKVKERNTQKDIFSGWMFASAPSLSPFEHQLYDLYAVDCRNDGEAVVQDVITVEATDIISPPKKPDGLADPATLSVIE